jgi:hypothetical protein
MDKLKKTPVGTPHKRELKPKYLNNGRKEETSKVCSW